YVAGKVARDGSQARFGTLTFNPAAPAFTVDITPPGAGRIRMGHALAGKPYLLYDFDFADLNASLQEHPHEVHFSFLLTAAWPGDPSLFRDHGHLHASYDTAEFRD